MTEDYKRLDTKTKVMLIAECRAIFGREAAKQLCNDLGFAFIEKQKNTPFMEVESVFILISNKGEITRSEVLRTLRWMNASALKKAVDKLVADGLIEVQSISPLGYGRPVHRYRLKNTPTSSQSH